MNAPTSKQASPKNPEAMRHFSQTYAQRTGTYFGADLSIPAVVIEGLAKPKDELGTPLFSHRHYKNFAGRE